MKSALKIRSLASKPRPSSCSRVETTRGWGTGGLGVPARSGQDRKSGMWTTVESLMDRAPRPPTAAVFSAVSTPRPLWNGTATKARAQSP